MAFRQSSYWWVKHGSKTGKQTNLQTVDNWVCDWFEAPHTDNSKWYSPMYNSAIDFAHTALMNLGGGHTEQRHLDYMLEDVAANTKMNRRDKAIYTSFFTDLFSKWHMYATG